MSWNLRVSAALHQGDRKYMEDQYAIHYECDQKTGSFIYVYFGIFDGHGGPDAAKFAKANLHKNIISNILFWSSNPNDVLKAIEEGFLKTHEGMWKEIGGWPRTTTGLPSTAGTTASIALIKDNRLYTGHVGDSGISLGIQPENLGKGKWQAQHLTIDHKPDSPAEKSRIEQMGGKVVPKAGVQRVVWARPREKGPVCQPQLVDHIPFLAVGRALGDLWSYNFDNEQYAISPKPDVSVMPFDPYKHKCIILASDGLWNLLDSKGAVATVEMTDRKWFREALYEKGYPRTGDPYYHHASTLVNIVLRRWRTRNLRADNTSAIVVMIDPPGVTVPKSLDKLMDVASKLKNGGEKFCARTYLKEKQTILTDTDRYILGMAGSYNVQYYDDSDRFELMFGKPASRYNRPKGEDITGATSCIAMYDVIIHKVMTPAKRVNKLPSLIKPAPITAVRRELCNGGKPKKFRPKSGMAKYGSWLDNCTEDDNYQLPEVDPANPDNLPVFIDEEENSLKKSDSQLIQEDQACDSPEEETINSDNVDSTKDVLEISRLSPDSTSLCSADAVVNTTSQSSNKIAKCLRGMAQSFVSLNDSKGMVTRRQSKISDEAMQKCNIKRSFTLNASQFKIKRKGSSLDLVSEKRRRTSLSTVQLTKISTINSPNLRPRAK